MGSVFACISAIKHKSKKNTAKKEEQTAPTRGALNQQQFPPQDSSQARQAPEQQVASAERLADTVQEQDGVGTAQAIKEVQKDAPVPIPIATSTTNPPTSQSTSLTAKMATDEDYMAFLDKANEDPSAGSASKSQISGKGMVELKSVDKGVSVPAVLKKATKEAFYISDADEPFVPVCLKFEGKMLPDEATFATLVSHPSPSEVEVQIMDIGEWDPQGQYKELVDAVREASKGSDVRVYRIEGEGSRSEYWVLGLEKGKLVGVKALAVES